MRHAQLVAGPLSWRDTAPTSIGALACDGPDDLTATGSRTSSQILVNKPAVKKTGSCLGQSSNKKNVCRQYEMR